VLEPEGDGRYRGPVDDGAVVIAEAADEGFVAEVGGARLAPADGDTVRFDDVPEGTVQVSHTGTRARTYAVGGQLLAVLLAFSLALRPPGFARSFPEESAPPGDGLRDDQLEAFPASPAVELEAQLMDRGLDLKPPELEPHEPEEQL
jgi:hypothetical protein